VVSGIEVINFWSLLHPINRTLSRFCGTPYFAAFTTIGFSILYKYRVSSNSKNSLCFPMI